MPEWAAGFSARRERKNEVAMMSNCQPSLRAIASAFGTFGDSMNPKRSVTLEKVADGFAITAVHLTLTAKIPGADKAKFEELAAKAKAGCPVSKLLNTKITLDATLTP